MPGEFVAHGSVELVNGLEILASLLESRAISQERLLDACARQFNRLLPHLIVYVLFVVNQAFEIASISVLVGEPIILRSIIGQVAVILGKLSGLLLQASLERQFRFILTLTSYLISSGRNY